MATKKSELTSKLDYAAHRLNRLYYVMREKNPDMNEARDLIDDLNMEVGYEQVMTEKWKKVRDARVQARMEKQEKEEAEFKSLFQNNKNATNQKG